MTINKIIFNFLRRAKSNREISMLIYLTLLVNSAILYGQCPDILSTNISDTNLCPGDMTTITLTGQNLPDGGTIDFYIDGTNGFNPYNNEGQYIGSSDITTPCAQGPTVLFAMIDPPPGPDRCDEFIVIHTGSGLSNIDDIQISSNIGFFNPFVPGNPNTFVGPCTPAIMNPGDPVPPNAIVIITGAYNTNDGETYDISNLCNKGLPVYVIASSNTACGGGHFTNTGSFTYGVTTPCGNSEFSYTSADSWSNLTGEIFGVTNVVADVAIPPLVNSPSTISAFHYTIPDDFCDNNSGGTYYITGIINPTPSSFCTPLETTSQMAVQIECSDVDLAPETLCQNDPIFDLNNLITTIPAPSGTWSGSGGIVISGTTINPATTAPGTYTLTFTPDGSCGDPENTTIEILEIPVAEINEPPILCLEPSGSYTFTLSANSTPGGEWYISPGGIININTGEIDFSSLNGGTTYTVTYEVSDALCPAIVSDQITFTPLDPQTPNITPFQDICELSSPIPLNPVQGGITGTWYYQGSPVTTFDPNGNVGSHSLTFTPAPGQCAESVETDIEVVAAITPDINLQSSVCDNAGNIPLPVNPDGVSGSWTGIGISGNNFNPNGLNGIITLTFTPNFGVCAHSVEHHIEVIETPVLVEIEPLNFCLSSGETGISINLFDYENEINGGTGSPIDWFYDFQLLNQINTPWDFFTPDDITIYASSGSSGCVSEPVALQINILDGYEIEILSNSDPIILCEGDNESILVYELNGAFLNYEWTTPSNDIIYGSQITVSESGTYTVTGSLDGCESNTATIDVIVSTPIVILDEIVTNASCDGGDGSIEIIYFGGLGNVIFEWENFPGYTGSFLDNLNTGIYNYTVSDESGCEYGPYSVVVGGADGSVVVNVPNGGYLCENSDFVLELILTEGEVPYTLGYSIDGIPQTPITINTTPFNFTLNAGEWIDEVTFTSVSKDGCPGVITGIPYIRVLDDISYSNLEIICDEENSTYQVTFDLAGGNNFGFVFVGPATGFINNDHFESFDIPFGDPYEFFFTTPLECDTLTISGVDNCTNDDCQPGDVPVALVNDQLTHCPNTNTLVELILDKPSTEYSFSWTLPYPPFTTTSYPLNATSGGNFSVIVTDLETGCQSEPLNFVITTLDAPEVTNISHICNDTDNTYIITFDITGGDDENYTVNPPGSGTLNGNSFISNPITLGSGYQFFVHDGGICSSVAVIGDSPACNGCDLEAGNMHTSLIVICEGNDVSFNYLGGYNGVPGEDTLLFLIENSAGLVLSRWNTTDISWAYLSSLDRNTTYYFSVIATELDNSGNPAFDSECLSIGTKTPFRISSQRSVNITGGGTLCHDEDLNIYFSFSDDGTYTIRYASDGTERTEVILSNNPDTLTVAHSISITDFQIISVTDEYGCEVNIDDNTSPIARIPVIENGPVTFECNEEDGTYTFSFGISGGASTNFVFLQGQGSINNGIFHSNPIPIGMSYTVRITDNTECSILEVAVDSPLCENCAIEAGAIAGDEIELYCANSAGNQIHISRSFSGFSNNPGEFLRFYLTTSYPITSSSDIIDVSPIPEFVINSPVAGRSYYIVGLANKSSDDTFDTDSDCHDLTNVIEIRFQLNGRRNISVELCENDFYEFEGEIFDINRPSGNFIFPGMAVTGCDSIVNIQLEFTDEITQNLNQILCFGESITINGNEYDSANPVGVERLNGIGQDCDTLLYINLSFTNEIIATETYNICGGDSILLNGVYYSENLTSGTHFFENGSVSGCDSTVNILIDIQYQFFDILISDADCPGAGNGSLTLFELINPFTPYNITLNGVEYTSILPFILNDLEAGDYTLTVDNLYCSWDTTFTINNTSEPEITLPGIINLPEGSSYQINAVTNMNPPYSIEWSPADDLSCTDCLNPVATPDKNTTYTLTLTSISGCIATSSITFTLQEPDNNVYIPNAFSPDLNGKNDVFILYADRDYVLEYSMTIFNRWGDVVYKHDKLLPGIETNGWDGMFKGKLLNPGIYVYVIEAKVSNSDRVKVYGGDITLIR